MGSVLALAALSVAAGVDAPGASWPAATAEESQRAWPGGRQPGALSAWPVKHGKVAMCWESNVMKDIHDGWPGQCVGLALVQAPTLETCRVSCLNDPRCSVWQFNPGQEEGGCWQGQGHHCQSRNGFAAVQFSGGQRIQHGSVRVIKQMAGIEVRNLRPIGKLNEDTGINIQRCREICYSDILCQFWQYGRNGCDVEDPTYSTVQYPLTLEGGATRSGYAESVVAGEFIQHYCPPRTEVNLAAREEKPDPLGSYANWRIVPYGILVSLILLMFMCVAFCVLDQKENTPAPEVPQVLAGVADVSPPRDPRFLPQAKAPLPMQLATLPQRFFSSRLPMRPGVPVMLAYPTPRT